MALKHFVISSKARNLTHYMHVLLLLAAVLGVLWTVARFRRRDASRTMLLAWCVLWIAVGVVGLIPNATNRLAGLLGIGRGADAVIYLAIVLILALLFRMSVRMEQLDRAITTVTRELALRAHDREQK